MLECNWIPVLLIQCIVRSLPPSFTEVIVLQPLKPSHRCTIHSIKGIVYPALKMEECNCFIIVHASSSPEARNQPNLFLMSLNPTPTPKKTTQIESSPATTNQLRDRLLFQSLWSLRVFWITVMEDPGEDLGRGGVHLMCLLNVSNRIAHIPNSETVSAELDVKLCVSLLSRSLTLTSFWFLKMHTCRWVRVLKNNHTMILKTREWMSSVRCVVVPCLGNTHLSVFT